MITKKIITRTTYSFVTGLVGLIILSFLASWVVASQLVKPHLRSEKLPYSFGMSISLPSDSGSTIAGWNIPAETSKGVVILLHPIRGSRLSMLGRARLLNEANYSIVMIDLQAHGESPGKQITFGHLEKHDVRAAIKFARQSYPNQPIQQS